MSGILYIFFIFLNRKSVMIQFMKHMSRFMQVSQQTVSTKLTASTEPTAWPCLLPEEGLCNKDIFLHAFIPGKILLCPGPLFTANKERQKRTLRSSLFASSDGLARNKSFSVCTLGVDIPPPASFTNLFALVDKTTIVPDDKGGGADSLYLYSKCRRIRSGDNECTLTGG